MYYARFLDLIDGLDPARSTHDTIYVLTHIMLVCAGVDPAKLRRYWGLED